MQPTIQRKTFERENIRELVKNTILAEKTFADIRLCPNERTHAPEYNGEKLDNGPTVKPSYRRTFTNLYTPIIHIFGKNMLIFIL